MPTRIFPLIALLLAPSAAWAGEAPLRPNARVQLAVPPVWDPIGRTFYLPEMVTVRQAKSLDNCSFYGGEVTIRKVEGDSVYFETKGRSKPLDFCNHLVTSRDNIRAWDIALVEEQKKAYSRESAAFRQQLVADMKEILDRNEGCQPAGVAVLPGLRYRLDGEVFWHGTNTAAITVEDSDSCHMEKNGAVDVLGYDRTGEFVLAVYRQPQAHAEKVEIVDIQQKHKMKRTCREGEKIVFALKKATSQFRLAKDESGMLGRLAALFQGIRRGKKTCAGP